MVQREQLPGRQGVFRGRTCLSRGRWGRLRWIVALAVVACPVLCRPATARISSDEMGWTERYKLVMSQDDRVCRPLLGVYNRLRARLFAQRKPFGLGSKGESNPLTDFERTRPEAFRAAHLFVPPSRRDPETNDYNGYPGDSIYKGDFLHRGSPVELRVCDVVNLMGHSYTDMSLVPGGEKVGIETLVADQAAAHPGAPWLTPSRYTLTGWPGFTKIARLAASGAQLSDTFESGIMFRYPIEFPLFGPEIAQRPFLIDGKDAVFLMNDPAPVPPLASWSVVVLTRLVPGGHEDLCYLALTPSGLTRTMLLESRGILDVSIPNSTK